MSALDKKNAESAESFEVQHAAPSAEEYETVMARLKKFVEFDQYSDNITDFIESDIMNKFSEDGISNADKLAFAGEALAKDVASIAKQREQAMELAKEAVQRLREEIEELPQP